MKTVQTSLTSESDGELHLEIPVEKAGQIYRVTVTTFLLDTIRAWRFCEIEMLASLPGFGPNDTMIAAIALQHDLTVVTLNTRVFARVSNLQLEDWHI